jgi:site-specific recombinase XerD
VAALKTFFDFCAQETEQFDWPNPVVPSRHAPKRGQRLPRDVNDQTIHRLWVVITSPRDQALFSLMLRAGLRVGEIVTLNRDDLLTAATADQPARLRVEGKGRKERLVYLDLAAYTLLSHWLHLHHGAADAPVFVNRLGQRLSVAGIQERLRHYCTLAGVQVTCHQLRHTFARQLIEQEMPVTSLAKLLGHSHLSTTQLYLQGADPQLRRDYLAAMARWQQQPPSPPPAAGPDWPAEPAPDPVAPDPPSPACAWYQGDHWASDLPDWVRQPCLAYLKQRQRNWKPSQAQRHSQRILRALAHFWRWQLNQRPITAWTQLRRADLQAYIDQRLAQGRAPNTLKNVISPLTQLLHFLQAEQGLAFAPSLFRLQLPKARQSLPRHLSDPEIHRLEALMRQKLSQDTPKACRDTAWFFVLAHTGLRLGELVDLRQDDLDLAGARLRIRQPKGRRDRIVYLSPLAVQALQRYLRLWPRQPHQPLFWRSATQPANYRWLQDQLRQLGQVAGVKHLSPHRLRHTFATRLINQGVPITTIQKLLGHRHLSSTQRYAEVAETTVERDYRQAIAALTTHSLAPTPLVISLPLTAPATVTNQFDNSV